MVLRRELCGGGGGGRVAGRRTKFAIIFDRVENCKAAIQIWRLKDEIIGAYVNLEKLT